ncbi:MAG: RHS repeat-associated core domain-containing protein [bacterium]|nr:RHS repeat-associated core domain-containing protein [bacterium]
MANKRFRYVLAHAYSSGNDDFYLDDVTIFENGTIGVDNYVADVISAQDYYAFGMLMPDRTFNDPNRNGYRFGFNGKEMDNEVKCQGASYDNRMRIYDPQLGKFLSVDPLSNSYQWYSPYHFAGNTPIWAFDIDGLEEAFATDHCELRTGKNTRTYALNSNPKPEDIVSIQFKYCEGRLRQKRQPNKN